MVVWCRSGVRKPEVPGWSVPGWSGAGQGKVRHSECKVQGRFRGGLVQARCKEAGGSGMVGSGVVWCRSGVRKPEVPGWSAPGWSGAGQGEVGHSECEVQGRFRGGLVQAWPAPGLRQTTPKPPEPSLNLTPGLHQTTPKPPEPSLNLTPGSHQTTRNLQNLP